MTANLQAALEELTAYPSTAEPFLSVYVDLTPDGNGRRPALQILEQDFDQIAQQVKNRDTGLESFEADRQRIMDYINTEAPVDVRGLAIFACNAEGVWQALPLQVPVETQLVEDRFAHTFNLARILDDYETYAVVLVDSQESRIFVVSLNEAEQAGGSEASDEIRRFEAGGWAQMLFQRRIDNVIKAHTRDMADQLWRIAKRYDVKHVVLAGNDSIKGAVRDSLPQQIKDIVVDFIHIDLTANLQSILETIEPMMRDVERQQEAADVDTLEAQVNTKGGLAVIGIENTALVLSKGQVRQLIIHQGFQALGSRNPNSGFMYPGMVQKDPFDGSELEKVDLREAFIAAATQSGSTIQIVEANEYLEQNEGVGAILWYRDDVVQPHQEPEQSVFQRGQP